MRLLVLACYSIVVLNLCKSNALSRESMGRLWYGGAIAILH